ncbi:MAG: serine--tRNA ligase, partial [Ignavibacteriae bacterium]|nr:serine--tRNA ligase [Ignavibacteriota bacterium]
MLDLKFIREHPDLVKEGIRKKGEADSVDDVLRLDMQRRDLVQRGEALKNRRNTVSEEIGKLKRGGQDASPSIAEMDAVKTQIKSLDDELKQVEESLNRLLLTLPNIHHPSVP